MTTNDSSDGLSSEEARRRSGQFGPNSMPDFFRRLGAIE